MRSLVSEATGSLIAAVDAGDEAIPHPRLTGLKG